MTFKQLPKPPDDTGASAVLVFKQLAKPPEEKEVPQVPVRRIFEVEFNSLQTPPRRQATLIKAYETRVQEITACLKENWPELDAVPGSINKIPEPELFACLSRAFRLKSTISRKGEKMLATSILGNNFNCYSSSVLLADTLARLGKPMRAVLVPEHILLAGETHSFETADKPEKAALPLSELNSSYPFHLIFRIDHILAITYDWAELVLHRQGRHEESLAASDEAIRILPEYSEAWRNKGVTLSELGRFAEALAAYDESIRLNPKDAYAWCCRGNVLDDLGRPDEALDAFNRSIELNPNDAEVWYNMGTFLDNKLGKLGEALDAFNRSIGLNPKDADAWENKGETLEKLGRTKEAAACARKSKRLRSK